MWSEWDDPVELRMRLDVALVEIAELTEENHRLRRQLGLRGRRPMSDLHGPTVDAGQSAALDVPRSNGLPYADASSSAE